MDGNTVLHWAANKGLTDTVNTLITNGADVNQRNDLGETALRLAVLNSHIDTVNTLITNGADVNTILRENMTLLHWAALYDHIDIVNTLITKGANVNAKDRRQNTAYDLAKNDEIKELLRQAMITTNHSTSDVISIDIIDASNIGDHEIVSKLVVAGADVNKKNIWRDSAS